MASGRECFHTATQVIRRRWRRAEHALGPLGVVVHPLNRARRACAAHPGNCSVGSGAGSAQAHTPQPLPGSGVSFRKRKSGGFPEWR